jgi:hypothetical protein
VRCDTFSGYPDEKGTKKVITQGQIFSTRHRLRACPNGALSGAPFL